ncbi:MAG: energy transducer TonB [Acidobacteriota bacterium]
MTNTVRVGTLVASLFLAVTAHSQELSIETNVFQGFRSAARTAQTSPLVHYLPPASGWSTEIASQRQQLREVLGLDGAALLTGDRATIAYGVPHRIEAMRGQIVVSVLPRPSGKGMMEFDVTITSGKDAQAVTTSASVSGRVGSTFVLGGRTPTLPDGWATADSPFFVFITPLERLSVPAVWPVGGEVTAPREISRVKPDFPPDAKREGRTGAVIFEVVVDASGAVTSVEIVRHADPDLEQAALTAVKQWRYEPATRNGAPVAVWFSITMRFPRPVAADSVRP